VRIFSYVTTTIDLRIAFIILGSIILLLLNLILEGIFLNIIAVVTLIWFVAVAYLIYHSLSFVKGDSGELDVASVLNKLPQGYSYLKDFVNGKRGNIDGIVVGPTGIWSIEIKNYQRGTITFKNGVLYNDDAPLENALTQTYAEAKSLESFLYESLSTTLQVNPVLVFTNKKTRLHFGFNKQKGVYVIGIKWLSDLVQKQELGYNLPPEQQEVIKNVLKKNTSIL